MAGKIINMIISLFLSEEETELLCKKKKKKGIQILNFVDALGTVIILCVDIKLKILI